MSIEAVSSEVESYLSVAKSFRVGLFRIWSAEAAFARLMCALVEFNASGRLGDEVPTEVDLQLARIPYASYESFAYITDLSHLVYSTTLLDTFISETTMFLLLLKPLAIGRKRQVAIGDILRAATKDEIVTQAAADRARAIGYESFNERLRMLRSTFGLALAIEAEMLETLNHYSSVRNAAVHDQGIVELRLNSRGQVTSRRKSCPRHPTRLGEQDVHKALRCYEHVGLALAEGVFTQVLKQGTHPVVVEFLRAWHETSKLGAT